MIFDPPDVDLQRRFAGLERLYGASGAAALRHSHVVVVGVGGVGSWAAEALARSAVGQLTLIDLDHVAESNINRQVHALTDTVGQAKVLAMQARIAQINPRCKVHAVEEFVEPSNWAHLLPSGVDAVIDACDSMPAKAVLAAWALRSAVRFICVGAAGGKQLAHKIDIDDLARCSHDPLLARLRTRLRKEHGAPRDGKLMQIPCVFSRETVAQPPASCDSANDGSLNCHGYGSVVSVTASFGMAAAGWVQHQIAASARP